MIFTDTTVKAMNMAQLFHAGQRDKSGAPYICHLMRVAESMETEEETVTALLHDVLEDTCAQKANLKDFSTDVQEAVMLLTRDPNETYETYIHKIKKNKLAKTVKTADLMEHLDPCREAYLTDTMKQRYHHALDVLLKDDPVCEKCRNCVPETKDGKLTVICQYNNKAFDQNGAGCQNFDSRYIQYPILVTNIDYKENKESLYPCGQPVLVRPCSDNTEHKSYFGILLGDMPYITTCRYERTNGTLTIQPITNPAIFVPKLNKIVYGYESWWQRITTPEDTEKAISDDQIDNVWYVRLLKEMTKEG